MELRTLGRSGVHVAPLCLGGNVFGWTIDQDTSFTVLDAYAAQGGNFIDTADVYSRWAPGNQGGESETVLGNWMAARTNRHDMIIATKAASAMGESPNQRGLSRRWIMQAVEDSLRRLRTDYIDVYQAHWDDRTTPLEETLRAFDDLVRAGKVRYIGASNYVAWRLVSALWTSQRHGYASYICLQPKYNLVDRAEFEQELEPACREYGLGVIGYSSLAAGFLSGKYQRDAPAPNTKRAEGVKNRYMHERGWAVLDTVRRVAERRGATPAQIALAWLLARPSVTAPIVSATSPAQLEELCGALTVQLTAEDLAEFEK